MFFILLHYLLSFVTVTSSVHQRFLCCVISSFAAISVPHNVRVRRYHGPPGGGGGPSLGDRPPWGGGGPSSLGWGRTRGGRVLHTLHAASPRPSNFRVWFVSVAALPLFAQGAQDSETYPNVFFCLAACSAQECCLYPTFHLVLFFFHQNSRAVAHLRGSQLCATP